MGASLSAEQVFWGGCLKHIPDTVAYANSELQGFVTEVPHAEEHGGNLEEDRNSP
jgi:hypothetical protein